MIIVGTPPVKLTRSDSARASIRAGSNPGMSTRVPRRPNAPSTEITQPPVWNRGIGVRKDAPSGIPTRSAHRAALFTTPM